MEETKKLTEKCHDLHYNALSEDVIERVKYLALDYLGVAARGSVSESSHPVQGFIANFGEDPDGAVVIGTNMKAAAPYAALANGAAAHSLELDDVSNEASLHPAVSTMSAALAAGHIAGCSGKEFIEAVVAGYEVVVRLGISLDPAAHYAQGFHPTGTCGTLGSAITVAKMLKLNQEGMLNALGIAGSQAAGSMEFLAEGAFTKRLHPGWAAHSGMIAALLAREGFTGPGTALEGKFGFLHAYSPRSNPARILENWGDPYKVMETSIKPHACCRYKQGPIDGILKIVRENDLKAPDIAKVTLGILKAGFPIVAQPEELKRNPRTIVDAQFSMPFGAALAIIYGRASLEEYTQENVSSPQVREMMERVFCVEDPELEKEFPKKWPASVEILTTKEDRHVTKIDYPNGDPENPLSWDELIKKFETLVAPIFSSKRVKEIIGRVQRLEKEDNLDSFAALLLK